MYDAFLKGEGTTPNGQTVYDLLGYDDEQMERVHDWIQWAFPNPLPSQAQPQATPTRFTRAQAASIMNSFVARAHSVALLNKTLLFWGIQWQEQQQQGRSSFAVKDGARLCRKLSGKNHNAKRMTRVLVFLYSTGQVHEAEELRAFLWQCVTDLPDFRPLQTTMEHWSSFFSEADVWRSS